MCVCMGVRACVCLCVCVRVCVCIDLKCSTHSQLECLSHRCQFCLKALARNPQFQNTSYITILHASTAAFTHRETKVLVHVYVVKREGDRNGEGRAM